MMRSTGPAAFIYLLKGARFPRKTLFVPAEYFSFSLNSIQFRRHPAPWGNRVVVELLLELPLELLSQRLSLLFALANTNQFFLYFWKLLSVAIRASMNLDMKLRGGVR